MMRFKSPQIVTLLLLVFFVLSCCYCAGVYAQPTYLQPDVPVEARVEDLMQRMTLIEKIGQLNQWTYIGKGGLNESEMIRLVEAGRVGSFIGSEADYQQMNQLQRAAENSRLKIPLLIATDAIHGHGMYGGDHATTIFPAPIGLASTWNPALVEQVALVTAEEMRATGFHWTFSPYIAVTLDSRWGRVGENFGEDPLLVSRMGAAMVKGYQGEGISAPNRVLANLKTFIGEGYSPNGRSFSHRFLSERKLREVFLPPFEAGVEAGAWTVMIAHTDVDGVPMHANRELITGVLREELGFSGFIVSDWMDIERLVTLHHVAQDQKEAVRQAVSAGIDIHMWGPDFVEPLKELVLEGKISERRVDRAVRDILTTKFKLGLFEDRYVDEEEVQEVLASEGHREVALQAARESIVLLKNEGGLLPLSKDLESIFVTGPNAGSHTALLGDWVQPQPDEKVTTVLEGLQQAVSLKSSVEYYNAGGIFSISQANVRRAAEKARQADVAVLVVGGNDFRYNNEETTGGENSPRAKLDLAGNQLALVKAVYETGTPTVVVLINGRPLAIEWIAEHVPAVVEAWEPGMEGGRAVADVLFGDYNPSGELPITIPRSVGHLPQYYWHRPSFTAREYELMKSTPLYSFGHGLSYTRFTYENLEVPVRIDIGEDVRVRVEVTNAGRRAGEEVVQVYIRDVVSSVTTPVKELKAFKRISLQAGVTRQVELTIESSRLALYNREMGHVIEPGTFEVMVGSLRTEFEVVD